MRPRPRQFWTLAYFMELQGGDTGNLCNAECYSVKLEQLCTRWNSKPVCLSGFRPLTKAFLLLVVPGRIPMDGKPYLDECFHL